MTDKFDHITPWGEVYGCLEREHVDYFKTQATQGVRELYNALCLTSGVRERFAQYDRESLESVAAQEMRLNIEKNLFSKAWRRQWALDTNKAYDRGKADAQNATRLVHHIATLARQGRKTVKIEDLMNIWEGKE